jgi:hypothetical protein
MTELRILLATVFLLLLSVFTLSSAVSASDDDRGESHGSESRYEREDDDDDDHHERLQKQRERLAEIRRHNQKKLRKPLLRNTQTGSTQTGSVTPPKTPAPVAVKPAPVVVKKPTTPVVTPTPAPTAVSKSSTVSYRTPDGSASIRFSATVKSGMITAASSTTRAGGTSGYYQDIFARGISAAAIGKKAAGLNLAAVGGASLTTNSFEQFIAANF